MTGKAAAEQPTNRWDRDTADGQAAHLWALLQRGATDRRSLWHTPTIATIDDAGAPTVRTVVLRAVAPADWTLRFHTDRRSPKFDQLQRAPQIALHIYDAEQKLQVRLAGVAALHTDDDLADRAWIATQPMSRVAYAQAPAPGVPIGGERLPLLATGAHDDLARTNFAAVVLHVTSIDWLHLAADGHRRARLHRDAGGILTSHWLAP